MSTSLSQWERNINRFVQLAEELGIDNLVLSFRDPDSSQVASLLRGDDEMCRVFLIDNLRVQNDMSRIQRAAEAHRSDEDESASI